MRIGIIGNGFVGKATQIFIKNYYLDADSTSSPTRSEILPTGTASTSTTAYDNSAFRPFYRHEHFTPIGVYIYDIRPEACVPLGVTLEDLDRECDLLFFCLPTPLNHDGSCYTRILEDTLSRCKNPFKIIRSTVPVGFSVKHKCYFMPEFLTEANWETDFRQMKEWIVGLPVSSVDMTEINIFQERINNLIRTSHRNGSIYSPTIVYCETNEAEMLKLMKNCFLAAKVSIMNEFYDFCSATNTDYETVATMAKQDARMGTSYFQVPGLDGRRGFGGTCFPKDTWQTTIPLPTPASKVIVVFSDGGSSSSAWSASPGSSVSSYLTDIIKTNLVKNNVVILVVRDGDGDDDGDERVSPSTHHHPNLIIKRQTDPGAPLFFPRVDECYYVAHRRDTILDTIRCVMNIIDLWDSHKEMILYVVKQRRPYDDHDTAADAAVVCEESGTEGFDSDYVDDTVTDTEFDYVKIIEDYYHRKSDTQRRLIILF